MISVSQMYSQDSRVNIWSWHTTQIFDDYEHISLQYVHFLERDKTTVSDSFIHSWLL